MRGGLVQILTLGRVAGGEDADQQETDLEISNKYFDNATWCACQSRKIITAACSRLGAPAPTKAHIMPIDASLIPNLHHVYHINIEMCV
jgi:hypothetical protein